MGNEVGRIGEGKRRQPQTPPHLVDIARGREIAASQKYKAISEHMQQAALVLAQVADLLMDE